MQLRATSSAALAMLVAMAAGPAMACAPGSSVLASDDRARERIALADPETRQMLRGLIGTANTLNRQGFPDACQAVMRAVRNMISVPAARDVEAESWDDRAYARVSARSQPFATAAHTLSSNDITGAEVRLINGEELGSVASILTNLADGATHLVVDYGAILGIGGRQVAIPINEIQIDVEANLMFARVTEEWLDSQPEWNVTAESAEDD